MDGFKGNEKMRDRTNNKSAVAALHGSAHKETGMNRNMRLRMAASLLMLAMICVASQAQAFVIGGRWGGLSAGGESLLGQGATVTWSLALSGTPCPPEGGGFGACRLTHLQEFLPSDYRDSVQEAFDAWSDVADLSFIEVLDEGLFGGGQIRIGGHRDDRTIFAEARFPNAGAGGDIHLNTVHRWHSAEFVDFLVPLLIHEIGHAIGLGHSSEYESIMHAFFPVHIRLPQPDDIAGAQFLYGPPRVAAVPEPGMLALLGIGFTAMIARRRLAR